MATDLAGDRELSASARRLVGRDSVITDLVGAAQTSKPPLTLVTGDTGIGRTAVLDEVRRRLDADGVRVLAVRVDEDDRRTPYGVLYQLLAELGGSAVRPDALASVRGLVAKLSLDADTRTPPEVAFQLATAICNAVRGHAPVVVVLDDAQYLDESTAALLEPMVRRLGLMRCSLIMGVRGGDVVGANKIDTATRQAALRNLRRDGLLKQVLLRPLTRAQSAALIRQEFSARPAGDLLDWLHGSSRGNPAALTAALEACRGAQLLRVVDRHVYRRPATELPALPESHPLVNAVRRIGSAAWPVARAMAILAPLGEHAPRLAAEELEIDEASVRAALSELLAHRVLVRTGKGWRFRLPVVRAVLHSCLGPYERRQLSARAAQAVWDGEVVVNDRTYLPDLLAEAGRLVDPARSADELLAAAVEVMFTDGRHAIRWLRAVVDRVDTPEQRAVMQMAHASACAIHLRMREAVASARPVLEHLTEHLTPDMVQELQIVYVAALGYCGKAAELTRIVDREADLLSGDSPQETVARGYALALLGRWSDAYALIREQRARWSHADPVTANFGTLLEIGAGVVAGKTEHLFDFRARSDRPPEPSQSDQRQFETLRLEIDMLLLLGENHQVEELMSAQNVAIEQLHGPAQFLIHFARGDWPKAMEIARRSIAEGVFSANPASTVVMYHGAVDILGGTGWLGRARTLAESARGVHLNHLLDFTEACIHRGLGEDAEADAMLEQALTRAERSGQLLGTEELLVELTVRDVTQGRAESAARHLARLREMADELRSGRAEIACLQAQYHVHGDVGAAREAVRLARARAQPYEMAKLFTRLALSGADTQKLLTEAYELFGAMDALLWRAKLRQFMRAAHVPVPGRSQTTAENERLLAILVTEGMTNRQLAMIFGTSEKTIEGRLTRLFARIGYRSRVELAAAILTGEYPAEPSPPKVQSRARSRHSA
ncbi:hypothetical protein GCM10011581_02960 [Saccharopolyspora subtropica]|uniref:HTH luxR-type domain-containing protein n=1 Tax=Saccharopolyspora thermophila TaxID=89367 RepID=A0A917JIV7_9PSEU|nr:AAA family ATPase [Saccharopolyspora subtropica]GGI69381.1 hypothetical protein GCM10011581_02960 [Saccharopolyspora subtropica]